MILGVALIFVIACQFKNHEREWRLLKDIGIKLKQLNSYLRFEYTFLGVLTGTLAVIISAFISNYMTLYLLDIDASGYNVYMNLLVFL